MESKSWLGTPHLDTDERIEVGNLLGVCKRKIHFVIPQAQLDSTFRRLGELFVPFEKVPRRTPPDPHSTLETPVLVWF